MSRNTKIEDCTVDYDGRLRTGAEPAPKVRRTRTAKDEILRVFDTLDASMDPYADVPLVETLPMPIDLDAPVDLPGSHRHPPHSRFRVVK